MKRGAPGVFVTGTDTGVGKTQIACALIRAAVRRGVSVVGMKPVAAGARRAGATLVNTDVEALRRAGNVRAARRLCNPYLLPPPIAPHLGARDAGIALEIDVVLKAFHLLVARSHWVIVEGAGGFRVPLDDRHDMSGLARRLRLPVVLVVGMRLGCISHALLTAEAIANRGLLLAGWVANRIDPAMLRYRDNVETLRKRLHAPLLGEIPYVATVHARVRKMDNALDCETLFQSLR